MTYENLEQLYAKINLDNENQAFDHLSEVGLTEYAYSLIADSTLLYSFGREAPSVRSIMNILKNFGKSTALLDESERENAMSGMFLTQCKDAVQDFADVYNNGELQFDSEEEDSLINHFRVRLLAQLRVATKKRTREMLLYHDCSTEIVTKHFYYSATVSALNDPTTFYGSNKQLTETDITEYGLRFVVALFWKAATRPLGSYRPQNLSSPQLLDGFMFSIIKGLRGQNFNQLDGSDDMKDMIINCGQGSFEAFISGMSTIFNKIHIKYSVKEYAEDLLITIIKKHIKRKLSKFCSDHDEYSHDEYLEYYNGISDVEPEGYDQFQQQLYKSFSDSRSLMQNIVCRYIGRTMTDLHLDEKLELLSCIQAIVKSDDFVISDYIEYVTLSRPNSRSTSRASFNMV